MSLRNNGPAPKFIHETKTGAFHGADLSIAESAGAWRPSMPRLHLRMLRPAILALAIAYFAPSSRATILQYVVSGEFSGNAPVSAMTEPDSEFSIVFDFDSSPTPYASSTNQSDLILPSSMTYTLAGNPVTLSTSNNTIALYPNTTTGGIGIILTDPAFNQLALYFYGPQIYTGSTSAPTLMFPETYSPVPSSEWLYFHNGARVATGGFIQASVINTPEPSSLVLVCLGLALPMILRRCRG